MVAYSSSNDMKNQYDLNSLQKSSRIIRKPPTATAAGGTAQQQPKVYQVKPIHFRELVQKLTGAQPGALQQSQTQKRRGVALQRVAPPPLPINPHHLQLQTQTHTQTQTQTQTQAQTQTQTQAQTQAREVLASENERTLDKREPWEGITELTLSPNFQAWFNFAMLSPGPAPVSN